MRVLWVAFPLPLLLQKGNSIWLAGSSWIPGSLAIRVPARVGLVLLVPAALALACLVQRLDSRGRRMAAWALAIACLAEQTTTTPTYDVAESRARIAAVARQADPKAESFYFRPLSDELFMIYGVDAMWASAEVGAPTVGGYSGGFPTGWWPLPMADGSGKISTEQALREWCLRHGLDRSKVQRIGRRDEREVDGRPTEHFDRPAASLGSPLQDVPRP